MLCIKQVSFSKVLSCPFSLFIVSLAIQCGGVVLIYQSTIQSFCGSVVDRFFGHKFQRRKKKDASTSG